MSLSYRNMDGAREILSISLDIKGSIRIHMHQALQSVKTNNIIHRPDLLSRCLRQLILQKRKTPEEGTDGPAELLEVVWLEISGSTPKPLPKGKRYALSFKISMAHYDPVWKTYPVYMLAKVGKKGTSNWEKINLGELRVGDIVEIPSGKLRFEVPDKAKDTTLLFGLYELWGGKWKQGLRIHEAVVEEMPQSIVLS